MLMAASQLHSDMAGVRGPIVIMGVAGCGKTSVGQALARLLGFRFIEGDSRHPVANVDKMRRGIPLQDDDRWPWLKTLGSELAADDRTVISCSALKRSYRDLLRATADRPISFVFLQGSRTLLSARMGAREGHYMPLSLLDSQLATLELPAGETDIVTVEIDQTVERIVSDAMVRLGAIGSVRPTLK